MPAPSAVTVRIGLDLRQLPTNTRPETIDVFVVGEGDDLRHHAPPNSDVEIRHVPGAGILIGVFRGAGARAACEHAVAAYMEHAPRLPITHQLAASVDEPCQDGAP